MESISDGTHAVNNRVDYENERLCIFKTTPESNNGSADLNIGTNDEREKN